MIAQALSPNEARTEPGPPDRNQRQVMRRHGDVAVWARLNGGDEGQLRREGCSQVQLGNKGRGHLAFAENDCRDNSDDQDYPNQNGPEKGLAQKEVKECTGRRLYVIAPFENRIHRLISRCVSIRN